MNRILLLIICLFVYLPFILVFYPVGFIIALIIVPIKKGYKGCFKLAKKL